MGSAPHELQTVLVINFFRTLLKENQIPGTIFFYADGIKLMGYVIISRNELSLRNEISWKSIGI